ncbi:putative Transcriptional regulator, GntR family [uncultured spirochete]|uniref:Putative Transcriptional regulator, GntR family n=1 Tax=uncultured spirochete TaxID=156406 RepID=A0A3P3XN22_9SPIR|nr:putative Transcriptional regulator, GntR family [uncultured spirochete]
MKQTEEKPKVSNASLAYDAILKAVVNHDLPPGNPLLENNLCAWLGMSRTPIREALNRLRAEGIVEYVRSKGFYVCSLSIEKIRQSYEAIEALESMVAYLVAVDHSHSDFPLVEKAVLRMEKDVESKDWDDWVKADEQFHAMMYKCCRNEYIVRYLTLQLIPAKQVRYLITKTYIDKSTSTKAHRATYDAIIRNDPERARALAQEHFAWIRREAMNFLSNFNFLPKEIPSGFR